MTTLSHIKGVRTTYRNILSSEIQEGNSILQKEISNSQEYLKSYSEAVTPSRNVFT